MPPVESRHSVGILLTHEATFDGPPDQHSFAVVDHQLVERLGWGRSGPVNPPTMNPPAGFATTVQLCLNGSFTEADKDAVAALVAAHRDRYNECLIFLADGGEHHDAVRGWVLDGAQPGSVEGGWGTDAAPQEEAS